MSLGVLQQRLGYRFSKPGLLQQALTHRSHNAMHNECLEFLGDSISNYAVTGMFYDVFDKPDKGDPSCVRANLVKQQTLYETTQVLQLPNALRLGKSELKSGGFCYPSVLADTLEAIFGAMFLDGGFDATRTLIRKLYIPILEQVSPRTLGKDVKTLLQEYLQGYRIALPLYAVVATRGMVHNQQLEVECSIPELEIRVFGSGASRRAVEQSTTKLALGKAYRLVSQLVKRNHVERTGKAHKQATPPDPQLFLRLEEQSAK